MSILCTVCSMCMRILWHMSDSMDDTIFILIALAARADFYPLPQRSLSWCSFSGVSENKGLFHDAVMVWGWRGAGLEDHAANADKNIPCVDTVDQMSVATPHLPPSRWGRNIFPNSKWRKCYLTHPRKVFTEKKTDWNIISKEMVESVWSQTHWRHKPSNPRLSPFVIFTSSPFRLYPPF